MPELTQTSGRQQGSKDGGETPWLADSSPCVDKGLAMIFL